MSYLGQNGSVSPVVTNTSMVTTTLTINLTTVNPNVNRNGTTNRTIRNVTHRPRTRNGVHNALLLDLTFVRTLAVCNLMITLILLFTGPFDWISNMKRKTSILSPMLDPISYKQVAMVKSCGPT